MAPWRAWRLRQWRRGGHSPRSRQRRGGECVFSKLVSSPIAPGTALGLLAVQSPQPRGVGADQGRQIALASLAGDQEILARSVTSETANRALSRSLKVAGETQSSLLYSHRLPTDHSARRPETTGEEDRRGVSSPKKYVGRRVLFLLIKNIFTTRAGMTTLHAVLNTAAAVAEPTTELRTVHGSAGCPGACSRGAGGPGPQPPPPSRRPASALDAFRLRSRQ